MLVFSLFLTLPFGAELTEINHHLGRLKQAALFFTPSVSFGCLTSNCIAAIRCTVESLSLSAMIRFVGSASNAIGYRFAPRQRDTCIRMESAPQASNVFAGMD